MHCRRDALAERLGAPEKMQPALDAAAGLPPLAQRFNGAFRR